MSESQRSSNSSRINSFTYQYTLLIRDSDECRFSGLVSIHDLPATKRLAHTLLRTKAHAAYVDIYAYERKPAAAFEIEVPVARISLDDERDEERIEV